MYIIKGVQSGGVYDHIVGQSGPKCQGRFFFFCPSPALIMCLPPRTFVLYPVVCGFYSEAYFFVQTWILFFHRVLHAILYRLHL